MKNKSWWQVLTGAVAGIVLMILGIKTDIINIDNGANDTDSTHIDSTIIKPASVILYGLNGLVKFNKVPLSDTNFLKAIDSTHIDIFRVPGGTNANYDSIGVNPTLQAIKLLVQKTGVKIMWDVNILTSTLDYQLSLLDSAKSLGIGVKFIELGNELNQFNYDGKARFPNAQSYADSCKRWITEIKKHFPNAKFGVVGENKTWPGAETWANTQITTNPDVFLIWHFYADGKFTNGGIFDSSAFSTLVHKDFNKSFGTGISPAKVWITEFNLTDHNKDVDDVSVRDTLNPDQIGVAVKFAFNEFSKMGVRIVMKHNVVSGEASNYPAVYADKKKAYMMEAGKAIRELQNKKTF